MKKTMMSLMRYTAVAMLTVVGAVAMIGVLAYYQEPVAVVPAMVALGSMMGAIMLINTDEK